MTRFIKKFSLFALFSFCLLGQSIYAESSEEIYDFDLMKANNIQAGLGADFDSIEGLVASIMDDYHIDYNNIGLAFYNFQNGEHYYINPHQQMIAASTAKVPIAALYIDLINQGILTYDSEITFSEEYLENGAGEVTNNPVESSYLLSYLIDNAIIYSDNSAWYALMANYKNFGSYREAILDFINFYDVPSTYYEDNYFSPYMAEQWLIKIANDPAYQYLIDIMKVTEPRQLFTSYVYNGMANKYGRLDAFVHDTGIYYENGQPQYVLVIYTNGQESADNFIEITNLRVNEWFRSKYIGEVSNEDINLDTNSEESAVQIKEPQEELDVNLDIHSEESGTLIKPE